MRIELNGAPWEVADDTTLAALVHQVTGSERGTAVAVDGEVAPRSTWTTARVQAGQHIELITAVQGG